MPSHSLNPELYPDGHGVVTERNAANPAGARHNARPVPQPMHLASIERDANVKAAIEFAMVKENLPYPAAAKLVHDKGEKFWLDQRDAVSNELNAAQNRPLTLDEMRPDGVSQDVNPILSQREAAEVGKDNFMGNPAYPSDTVTAIDPRVGNARLDAVPNANPAYPDADPAYRQGTREVPGSQTSPLRPGEEVVDVDATKVSGKPKIVAKGK